MVWKRPKIPLLQILQLCSRDCKALLKLVEWWAEGQHFCRKIVDFVVFIEKIDNKYFNKKDLKNLFQWSKNSWKFVLSFIFLWKHSVSSKNALNAWSFLKLKRLSYIVCHGDSNFPHLISPINAGDQRYDSATFFRLASQCALFHTEGIADGIKLKLLRIFGSHTFFHKLVPIKYWKRPKIKYYELFIIILTYTRKLFLLRALARGIC